jgi:hypothetical protein
MRRLMMFATLAVAVACGAARGQDAPDTPPDPTRLELAEQIVAANGGNAQATTMVRSMFAAMRKGAVASSPPETRDLIGPMFDDMAQALVTLEPQLIDLSTRAYARAFTEKELRDLLAFQTSETGRAVAAKLPALQAQVISQTFPLIMTAMPAILRKSVDRICQEKHCTSQQREAIEKAMSHATGASTS